MRKVTSCSSGAQWKSWVGMFVLMLSVLAGLMTQSRQARAEMERFPTVYRDDTNTANHNSDTNSPTYNDDANMADDPVALMEVQPTPTPTATPTPKPIFPLKVIQVGGRRHRVINGAVSPFNGNIYYGNPPDTVWGFSMGTSMRLLDNQSPAQPYTKGKIGEQVRILATYGPIINGVMPTFPNYEDGETVVDEGHGGDFVDLNACMFNGYVPDDPDEDWLSLDQAWCVLDCDNAMYRPSAEVRKWFTQQTINYRPYSGLVLSERHRLGYHRGYYTRTINGVQQP